KNLLVVRSAPVRKAPFQYLFVRAAGQRAFDERCILDTQKAAHALVRARGFVIRRQFALRVQANLVEHPSEENEPAGLLGRMSEPGNFHSVIRWNSAT